ncbi:MAG TPA: c-type cytochrome [Burkholderiales bacterium]|nr:c-type cytochrome [Burkholderiales bacterium]
MNSTRAGLVAAALLALVQAGFAQAADRSGKEVVDAVCAGCHATGAKGAPKIGDKKAWAKRASQGLTSLTEHALKGMRDMPSHGGQADLTDLEIGRAITYMVNKSGGNWKEPASVQDMAAQRTGKQIVDAQCSKCHAKGDGGAPKIGDRAAWAPRMKQGVDALVASAIRGHGGMPARGDKADLTDSELKAAITYMFNPVADASAKPAPKAEPAAASDQKHKSIGGMDIYLGVLPADSLRKRQAGSDKAMYGGIPSGSGYYLVSVTLRDSATKAEIKGAEVEARVANLMTGETRALESATINNIVSYGSYFQMPGKDPYTVTLKIRKPGAPQPVEARFDLK